MRPFVLGLLGGLVALALVGAALGGVALYRQRTAPARLRVTLTADLDAYTAWERDDFCGRHLCVGARSLAQYAPERDLFMEDHPTLRAYYRWWLGDRRARYGGSYANVTVMDWALPVQLNEPDAIARYVAGR